MSDNHKDNITKVGAIYGAYFIVQAYGYSSGVGASCSLTLNQSIIFGFEHLMHIFRPWGDVAWPLSPFIAFILLFFAINMPTWVQAGSTVEKTRNFISLLVTASIFTLVPAIFSPDRVVLVYNKYIVEPVNLPIVISILYIVSVCVMFLVVKNIITRSQSWQYFHSEIIVKNREEVSFFSIGLILVIAYSGSQFDGKLDRAELSALEICESNNNRN